MLGKEKGFTLIELLLYTGLAAIMLLVISQFLSMVLQTRVKNQTIAEVETQGAQAMQLITYTIRNADNITSPTAGSSSSSLTLDVINPSKDPTVFDLSSGTLRITEGAGTPLAITSNRVTVTSLNFRNVSRAGTAGIIKIEFTLTHKNLGGKNEYDFTQTFYKSASLR